MEKKSWVWAHCSTYTGKDAETPLFTVHLYHSETSGVAEGGKRQILAVWVPPMRPLSDLDEAAGTAAAGSGL